MYVPRWNCWVSHQSRPKKCNYILLPRGRVHHAFPSHEYDSNLYSCVYDPPVRQGFAFVRGLFDILKELIHGMTHTNWRKFTMGVGHSTNAAQLYPKLKHDPSFSKCRLRTFSSIFGSGPPPPSPFPNTSKAVSEDSRFYYSFNIHSRRSGKRLTLWLVSPLLTSPTVAWAVYVSTT